MITWNEFERQQPALAGTGRGHLYQAGIGLAFLATVRPDGGPRVHPVCPVIRPAGLHLLIIAGPPSRPPCAARGVTRSTATPARRPARTTASPSPAGSPRSPTRRSWKWS